MLDGKIHGGNFALRGRGSALFVLAFLPPFQKWVWFLGQCDRQETCRSWSSQSTGWHFGGSEQVKQTGRELLPGIWYWSFSRIFFSAADWLSLPATKCTDIPTVISACASSKTHAIRIHTNQHTLLNGGRVFVLRPLLWDQKWGRGKTFGQSRWLPSWMFLLGPYPCRSVFECSTSTDWKRKFVIKDRTYFLCKVSFIKNAFRGTIKICLCSKKTYVQKSCTTG